MFLIFQRISVPSLQVQADILLWLPDPEHEATVTLWNNKNYSPSDTASHLTGPESSSWCYKHSDLVQNMWKLHVPIFHWNGAEAANELGLIDTPSQLIVQSPDTLWHKQPHAHLPRHSDTNSHVLTCPDTQWHKKPCAHLPRHTVTQTTMCSPTQTHSDTKSYVLTCHPLVLWT